MLFLFKDAIAKLYENNKLTTDKGNINLHIYIYMRSSLKECFIKHKLKISASNNSLKKYVVTYKKVTPDAMAKDLIGESNKAIIMVLGDSVKYKRI